jgi:hypothetical protein
MWKNVQSTASRHTAVDLFEEIKREHYGKRIIDHFLVRVNIWWQRVGGGPLASSKEFSPETKENLWGEMMCRWERESWKVAHPICPFPLKNTAPSKTLQGEMSPRPLSNEIMNITLTKLHVNKQVRGHCSMNPLEIGFNRSLTYLSFANSKLGIFFLTNHFEPAKTKKTWKISRINLSTRYRVRPRPEDLKNHFALWKSCQLFKQRKFAKPVDLRDKFKYRKILKIRVDSFLGKSGKMSKKI